MERGIEFKYAIGEGVAPTEIIKEPAVDFGITQCLLNFTDTLIDGRGHSSRHLIVALPSRQ
jgi:hypothetical protein